MDSKFYIVTSCPKGLAYGELVYEHTVEGYVIVHSEELGSWLGCSSLANPCRNIAQYIKHAPCIKEIKMTKGF